MPFRIKNGGAWKNLPGDALKVKVGGAWKTASMAYIKVGGVWKEGYSNFNAATGGTVTTVSNYNGTGQTWKVHTFTTNQNIVISAAPQPFRVLVQGGGAGWGVFWDPSGTGSGGGSGGTDERASFTTTPGTYAVVVGGRGANGGYQVFGGAGGTSSVFGISVTGGTTNGNHPMSDIFRGTPPGGAPSGGLTSNITGSSYGYAGAYGGSNYGAGSTWSPHGGGAQGVVIVSYRVG